jgi:membrane protease YdiL (CAAX protease family)
VGPAARPAAAERAATALGLLVIAVAAGAALRTALGAGPELDPARIPGAETAPAGSLLGGLLHARPGVETPIEALAMATSLVVRIGFEEFGYRGLLLATLRDRLGGTPAVIVQGLFFGLATGLGGGALGATLALQITCGLGAGIVTLRAGHLAPAWAARVAGSLVATWAG